MQAISSWAPSHAGLFDHAPSLFSYAREGNGLQWIRPRILRSQPRHADNLPSLEPKDAARLSGTMSYFARVFCEPIVRPRRAVPMSARFPIYELRT